MRTLAVVFILPLQLTAVAGAQPGTDAAALARTIVERLAANNFSEVVATFDQKMHEVVPEEKLRFMWTGLIAEFGAFKGQQPARVQSKGEVRIALVTCEFERGRFDLQLVFNAAGQVAGLFLRPARSATPFIDSPYVDRSRFSEREITVDAGGWPLPGTLTMPNGAGPWPAVVLVHGSGPSDRDETVGPNKPFRDLAHGLGSRGIAVLRYEKRTRQYGPKVAPLTNFTVKEETVDDAVAAVTVLRATQGIDSTRIFVAGHSLGGMVAPRIAVAAGSALRGAIVLAGPAGSLEQAMIDQSRDLALRDGAISPDEQRQIDELEQLATRIKTLKAGDPPISAGLIGAPASYFIDLRGYDPPAAAAKLSLPMLVLQGGRDFQVTMDDYAKWKAALANRSNVTFADFPLANHLFVVGTGRSSPSEYMAVAGHVSSNVIDTIVDWISRIK